MRIIRLRHFKNRLLQQTPSRTGFSVLVIAFLLSTSSCSAWGFSAHRKIVRAAIHHLPKPLHAFFKAHGQWLHDHINDADLRKHAIIGESARHYIDLDQYCPSLDTLEAWFPMTYAEGTQRWSEDSLIARGIGPWHAAITYRRLINAFDQKDQDAILRYAVDLAHYISDLHVPLHTSENYDGKKTGQAGIHSLWETQLPEMFMAEYNLFPFGANVRWIKCAEESIWQSVLESHACLDSVFKLEMRIRQSFDGKRIDAYVERGRTRQLMRSPEFAEQYHAALHGQVERRMAAACNLVSSLWYSAWIESGAPVLTMERPVLKTRWKKVLDWLFK